MTDNLIEMQHATKAAASFSHAGETYDSDDEGVIEIPAHFAGEAKAHGFGTPEAKSAPKPKGGVKAKADEKADDGDDETPEKKDAKPKGGVKASA